MMYGNNHRKAEEKNSRLRKWQWVVNIIDVDFDPYLKPYTKSNS